VVEFGGEHILVCFMSAIKVHAINSTYKSPTGTVLLIVVLLVWKSEHREVFIGSIRCTDAVVPGDVDEHLYSGKEADDPRVEAVLAEFTDVLVSNLPPGMRPERYGQDGKPIEHTIDLDPSSKPYAAQARRLTREENAERQRELTQLLNNE
jgi:hypothetical protein